jgi:hypothetical protein
MMLAIKATPSQKTNRTNNTSTYTAGDGDPWASEMAKSNFGLGINNGNRANR